MIWLIIVLAFILRLINLNQSLWFDEAINVVAAGFSDFWWFVARYSIGDFHPPGWFAILWVWGHIFGFSEISVRLPSVFFGVATVWLIYLLGKELFNRKVGLLAALFLAIAPLHIYYSQEARMYVFSTFAVTLSFYFLHRLTINRKWSEIGYIVSIVLVLYSDYLPILVIPTQIFYLLFVKKINIKILVSYFIAGVAFFPWLTIFPLQLQTGINKTVSLPGWEEIVGGSNVRDLLLIPIKIFFGKVTLSNKILYAAISVFTGLIFGSIFLNVLRKLDKSKMLLISWVIIPLFLAFSISFFVPVLSYFRMIFILPGLYLIMAKSILEFPRKIAIASFSIILFISIASLLGYYFEPRFQREDWRGAVNFVSQNLEVKSIVIFENNEVPAPVRYYNPNLSKFKPGLSVDLASNLEGKNKIYLFEYLADVYDPNRIVEQKIKGLNFIQKKVYDFHGVGFVKLYVK